MFRHTAGIIALTTVLFACQSNKEPVDAATRSADQKKKRDDMWKETKSTAGTKKRKGAIDNSFAGSLVKDPFKGCNYSPQDDSDNGFKPVTFTSTDSRMVGDGWEVMARATASFNGKTTPLGIGFNFNVLSAKPAIAGTTAKKEAARFSNDSQVMMISNDEAASALGRGKDTPTCGVLMTNEIVSVSKSTGESISATLDPPIPFMLNPLLTAARANYELENGISMENVTATIRSSDARANGPQTGSAEIFLVDEKAPVTDSTGAQTVFDADFAYGTIIQFDSGEAGFDVPVLDQVTYYYVKGGSLIGMVLEVPREELSVLVFKK
jgi:hypothetical protein